MSRVSARTGMIFRITALLVLLGAASCATAPPVRKIGYTIQAGAFSDVTNAERMTGNLREKGIEAFYYRKENGLYAVRFGDFTTYGDAEKKASRLVLEGVIAEYYITPPPSAHPKYPAGETRASRLPDETGKDGIGLVTARTAERFVGIPYRWGGNNVVEGMDCSGFVRAVYNLVGVVIPRTAAAQFKTGRPVARGQVAKGDLVFFRMGTGAVSHVGIYIGGNSFVHAPGTGKEIRVSSLKKQYFSKNYAGARRFF